MHGGWSSIAGPRHRQSRSGDSRSPGPTTSSTRKIAICTDRSRRSRQAGVNVAGDRGRAWPVTGGPEDRDLRASRQSRCFSHHDQALITDPASASTIGLPNTPRDLRDALASHGDAARGRFPDRSQFWERIDRPARARTAGPISAWHRTSTTRARSRSPQCPFDADVYRLLVKRVDALAVVSLERSGPSSSLQDFRQSD